MKGFLRADDSGRWVTIKVNLRRSQYEMLARISDELGMSTSRVTRRIVAQFLSDAESDNDCAVDEDADSGAPVESRP